MNKLKLIILSSLALLLSVCCVFAQESPVKWTFKTVKINDSVAELQFKANIEQNWHLYSQYTKGIELPIVFNFDKSAQYKRLGKVTEPKPIEETDEMFGTSRFFNQQVTFKQRVQVLDNKPFTIKGKLEGQACKDGRCTQVEQKFAFDIKGFDNVAMNNEEANDENINPATDSLEANAASTTQLNPAEDKPAEQAGEKKEESLWKYFLGAILGGLVGLLMPCVFPMIPMTVSFFSKEGHKGKRDALLYGFFIVLIFLVFGLVLSAIFGADFGNIMSTHWIPNLLFAIIFLIFAFSL